MKLEATQRLRAAVGPDRDYANVGNRLLRAIKKITPEIKPPRMSHTSEGYTYTFQPAQKIPRDHIARALVSLDPRSGTFHAEDNEVVFHLDTPYGVQYQEVFTIIANDDEPESRIFSISLKDK